MGSFATTQMESWMTDAEALCNAYANLRDKSIQLTNDYWAFKLNHNADNAITTERLVGTQWEGKTPTELTAILTTTAAYESLMAAGHFENISALRK